MAQVLSARLSWAVPVRPDDLCIGLETFEQTLPALQTLRLCHRFGQGADVYITKLPNELEVEIEELLLTDVPRTIVYTIQEEYKCFEARCDPMDHIGGETPAINAAEDVYRCRQCKLKEYGSELFAELSDVEEDADGGDGDDNDNLCRKRCTAETSNPCDTCRIRLDPKECENTCEAMVRWTMNQHYTDTNYIWEWDVDHDSQSISWLKRISQKDDGGFVKLGKLLADQFGLQACFANTRANARDPASLPRHKNHEWHIREPETTLCYLTLPEPAVKSEGEYYASDQELDCGSVIINGAQAVQVRPDDLGANPDISARFSRALKLLGLKPHPKIPMRSASTSKATRNASFWPQLTLLVEGQSET